MYIKDLYEAVLARSPMSQPKFLYCLDAAARFLLSQYGFRYVANDGVWEKPVDIDGDLAIRDAYYDALCEGILSYADGDPERRTDFLAMAEYAYKTVWTAAHRRSRLVGSDYGRGDDWVV